MTRGAMDGDLPTLPMPRSADGPPTAYATLREQGRTKVRLWNGAEAWLATRYDDVRAILADDRFSADGRRPGYHRSRAGCRLKPV